MTWTVHEGDALSILDQLPVTSIDAVIADPPYNSGGRTPTERTGRSSRDKYVSGHNGNGTAHGLADFAGESRDQRGYVAWLGVILSKCLHATRPGGAALVFTDWRQLSVTTDALQVGGWTLRGIAVWHKPIARPQPGRLRQECEFIVWGSNGPMHPGADPVYLPGLYSASQPRGTERQHITQKPLDVMRQLVRIVPEGGTVLDPFAGSGTTGVAALTEGRNFVGCEITPHYAAIARPRLAEAA
ncbi:DNA methylase [Streptomyces tateyamensis]|uniref:Methyltransferase n=1 Tax=Streptomyces tateyamensis TaxID=565073 RepID=A0A2V4P0Z7_9ACTN|nr:site-specific DNA-methyltransferase [Streptomyces tateyamensis]PYC83437.1 DNA methylase [Streptomyces tateyamensis]